MAIPSSRAEFKSKILRELGEPVVKVNLADVQVEDAVDSALQYWQLYHVFSQERTYLKIEITQDIIDNAEVTLPENVLGVVKLLNPAGIGGSTSSTTGDNMFSFQYQFTAASMWDLVQFGNVSGYFIANQYLSELDKMLGKEPGVRFSRYTSKMSLDFDCSTLAVGNFLIVECYATLDPTVYSRVWGDRDLLNLAVAYAKKIWGRNLRKFANFQLPAGMTLNGDAVYQEGVDEVAEMEDRIKKMSAPFFFIMA